MLQIANFSPEKLKSIHAFKIVANLRKRTQEKNPRNISEMLDGIWDIYIFL